MKNLIKASLTKKFQTKACLCPLPREFPSESGFPFDSKDLGLEPRLS